MTTMLGCMDRDDADGRPQSRDGEFADYLQQQLRASGIGSQLALARKMDMDYAQLNKIFRGKTQRPELETIARFAAALGRPVVEVARAAGYPIPAENAGASPRQPVPAAFVDAFSEMADVADEEIVAYVEAKPGRYHRAMMARERQRRSWPSYVRFCRGIFRAWTSNQQLALEASDYSDARE